MAQSVGAVLKEMDEGERAAECLEIPWAIDIRQCLEQSDRPDPEHHRDDEIGTRTTRGMTPRAEMLVHPREQRSGD